ncbi:MAG TPA: hypothetical protein VG013_11250 [Gemmataceae bacterium]|jgi:hypothetical protein|nr:hypothetical protein [Gemmataceae bacterium]
MRFNLLVGLAFGVWALSWSAGQRSLAQGPKARATLKGHGLAVLCVAFTPDGKTRLRAVKS